MKSTGPGSVAVRGFCIASAWAAVFAVLAWLPGGCDNTGNNIGNNSGTGMDTGSDFALLAQGAQGYTQARPGRLLVFPRDHGAHPDYRIEWWYLTANLSDPEGRPYGAQWTLFRIAIQPVDLRESPLRWQDRQLFMAHFAITTPAQHVSFQRYARGNLYGDEARSGVKAEPFQAWLDNWTLQSAGSDWLPMKVHARQDRYGVHLQLTGENPPVLQGVGGFSQKHPNGGGSYYYSQPFLQASGELTFDGQTIPVTGQAWLDREWSSQFLQTDQAGWDWFSLHLESGEKLMLFQLRQQQENAGNGNFLSGLLIAPDGTTTLLDPQRIFLTKSEEITVAGRKLPLHWQIRLPQIGRELLIEALHPNQWMEVDFPYWEGVVLVTGAGPKNRGRGYMELTGYSDES